MEYPKHLKVAKIIKKMSVPVRVSPGSSSVRLPQPLPPEEGVWRRGLHPPGPLLGVAPDQVGGVGTLEALSAGQPGRHEALPALHPRKPGSGTQGWGRRTRRGAVVLVVINGVV